jgi:hypothetical protein
MATNWVCPIDGALPADNGTDTSKSNNSIGASATGDVNGNPPHCAVCGTALIVASATVVTAKTGVASGSQTPANIDAAYVTQTSSQSAQYTTAGATAITGGQSIYPHTYAAVAGVVKRGNQTADINTATGGALNVTAETINAVQGP